MFIDKRLIPLLNPSILRMIERMRVSVYVSDAMPKNVSMRLGGASFFVRSNACYIAGAGFDCIVFAKRIIDDTFQVNFVMLHELGHATGNFNRLFRPLGKVYASQEEHNIALCTEEHIAELSAVIMAKRLGLDQWALEEKSNKYMRYYCLADKARVLHEVAKVVDYLGGI